MERSPASGSSSGISAQLLGEYCYEFEEDDLNMSFFFDIDAVIPIVSDKIWEAEGHRTMLEATRSNGVLQRLTLLEGRTIDFLFGLEGEVEIYNVKKYIRSLHEHQQNIAAEYYLQIYTIVIEYIKSVDAYGLCGCCVEAKCRKRMCDRLLEEYQNFRVAITMQRNTGLIDDI
jgi:hypothetical protein